jgi:hypothetical protein
MKEYEIYVPTVHNDGIPTDAAEIAGLKRTLTKVFGGYTHLRQHSEGEWRIGGVTFRDEVTILRVLDDGTANFDMRLLKKTLEKAFKQKSLLIVAREVSVIT